EDYDWWTFSLAFNTTQEQIEDLYKYEFAGYDELGVYIDNKDSRVIVTIHCRVDMSSIIDPYDYEDYYDDEDDEDIEFATDDELLNLLVQVRHQLIKGDYRTLYAVWEQYGFDKEDEDNQDCEIPVPPEKNSGNDIVEQFKNILAEE
ncbi:MAG: hypothetical protein PHE70_05730, partial [Tepidanaerobacteraceae bacterium]|nr:hypothetical protein [Tepidanaerobacteraceae bacterium]